MGLLRLAPEIQQHILSMPDAVRRPAITERALRPIAQMEDLADQKAKFQELVGISAFRVRAEGPSASLADIPGPGRLDWPRTWPALPTDDDPVDARKVESAQRAQQRFQRQKPDSSRRPFAGGPLATGSSRSQSTRPSTRSEASADRERARPVLPTAW